MNPSDNSINRFAFTAHQFVAICHRDSGRFRFVSATGFAVSVDIYIRYREGDERHLARHAETSDERSPSWNLSRCHPRQSSDDFRRLLLQRCDDSRLQRISHREQELQARSRQDSRHECLREVRRRDSTAQASPIERTERLCRSSFSSCSSSNNFI